MIGKYILNKKIYSRYCCKSQTYWIKVPKRHPDVYLKREPNGVQKEFKKASRRVSKKGAKRGSKKTSKKESKGVQKRYPDV